MIVLGLGSNFGDRLSYIRRAMHGIKGSESLSQVKIKSVSPLYESDAFLPPSAPPNWDLPYLNCAVLLESKNPTPDDPFGVSPLLLLKAVKEIEKRIGRQDRGRWAPREIDIDILAMGDLTLQTETLSIPHPALLDRPFALLPLADVAPLLILPSSPSTATTAEKHAKKWRSQAPHLIPGQTKRSLRTLTELVGILNVTPDSFSDGGQFKSVDHALLQVKKFISEGVEVIDLGAESTNPNSAAITPAEEWRRLEPILSAIKKEFQASPPPYPLTLSLDTRHKETAALGLKLGVDWINDVSGFQNLEMQEVMSSHSSTSDPSLVFMHSLTVPADRKTFLPPDCDPVEEVLRWAHQRIDQLIKRGISKSQLIFDPGFGFGKTKEQSWTLLREISRFHELGVRILVGHSRKSFLTSITDVMAAERDPETITLTSHLARHGIDYLRVHDTQINRRALTAWNQIDGVSQW